MFGWNSNREDKSPEALADLWTAKFGTRPHPELIEAIEDWRMDRRGNFHFRMQSGRKVFVGYKKTEDSGGQLKPVVESEGGWFAWLKETPLSDAWHLMLAHYSLGNRSINFHFGSRKAKAKAWAAAMMLDIKIKNYEPDALALEYLQQLRAALGR